MSDCRCPDCAEKLLRVVAEIRWLHAPVESQRYNYATGEMETRAVCSSCCQPDNYKLRADCNDNHTHSDRDAICPTADILDRAGA